MKKLLTAMMLLLPLAAMAQHWTAKTNQDYPHETVINAQVNINGQVAGLNDGLELAAFIGNECRADAFVQEVTDDAGAPTGNIVFTLRVSGDGESEIGQPITFRAFHQNIEYQFNIETEKFQGEATPYQPSTPLVLNLDAVTGITLDETIPVNKESFPCNDYDLSPYVKLVYGEGEKKNESKILSPITYEWRTTDEMLAFDNANNKVTIQNAGTATANLIVYIGDREKQEYAQFPAAGPASTTFIATIASIPVTGIACDITEPIDFYAFDDFAAYMTGHVTIEPGTASNKEYSFECVEDAGALVDNKFVKGGEFTVNIRPKDQAYQGDPAKVTVKVYVRPTNIAANESTIQVNLGEDLYAALKANQTLTWPTDADPGVWGKSEIDYIFDPDNSYIDANGKAIKTGTVNVTVWLKNGITPSMTFQGSDRYTVTVNIVSALVVTAELNHEATTFAKGSASTAAPAYVHVSNPGNEPFEPTDLSITFNDRYAGFPYAEQISIVKKETDGQGITTYEFSIMPLYVGITSFDVTYKGNVLTSGRIEILKKEELSKGWTWLSLITDGGNVSEFLTKDDIVEVRSQDKLTYNDPQYGYFGHLTTLSANEGMYKVMTNKETSVDWGSNAILKSDAEVVPNKVINKGFNWVNYPYEFDVTPDRIPEFLGADFTPADGDRIITQSSGFAVYKAETGTWEAKEFALKEGKGLMYYSTADGAKTITFNLVPIAKPAEGNVRAESFTMPSLADEILQYDVHAFADNMSMIAEVENLDFPEDYTLGVFVNGECRGRGRVAVDGKMFVSAVGISGENVTFKLVNNFTGDMLPVEGSVSFGMVKGSLKAPVKLIAGDATGINKVDRTQQTNEMYDLSGRRVAGSQRGVIIERMDNGTIRKVVKK